MKELPFEHNMKEILEEIKQKKMAIKGSNKLSKNGTFNKQI